MSEVTVVIGAGSIGQAIARRVAGGEQQPCGDLLRGEAKDGLGRHLTYLLGGDGNSTALYRCSTPTLISANQEGRGRTALTIRGE